MIFRFLAKPYLAIFCTLVILILCVLPNEDIPKNITDDKTAHLISFATLALLWQFTLKDRFKTIMGLVIFAILIEFTQHLLPDSFHRGYELADLWADSIGILIGILIFSIIKKILPEN